MILSMKNNVVLSELKEALLLQVKFTVGLSNSKESPEMRL
jgi:hypothetical protein